MVSLQRDFSQQLGGKNMSEEQPLGQCCYYYTVMSVWRCQVQNWPPPSLHLIFRAIS